MKSLTKILLVILILSVPFTVHGNGPAVPPAAPPAEPAVTWINSYDDAIAQAKKQQRPVLLDFHAGWCGWCFVMDKEVYTDPRVVKLTRNYICVKVDVDQDQKTSLAYKIDALPRTVILNRNGEITVSLEGYLDADRLIKILKGANLDASSSTNDSKTKVP